MRSRARVLDHPIHPMLVPIPIAGFLLALVGDVVYFFGGSFFWHGFATWCMGFGILGALAAAVPGLIDYASIATGPARPTATRHMVLNLSIVAVFVLNLALRLGISAPSWGMVGFWTLLSLVGVGMLVASGWLGGTLVYQHRIGVPDATAEGLRVTMAPEKPRVRNPKR